MLLLLHLCTRIWMPSYYFLCSLPITLFFWLCSDILCVYLFASLISSMVSFNYVNLVPKCDKEEEFVSNFFQSWVNFLSYNNSYIDFSLFRFLLTVSYVWTRIINILFYIIVKAHVFQWLCFKWIRAQSLVYMSYSWKEERR